jgi:hypothetical protein
MEQSGEEPQRFDLRISINDLRIDLMAVFFLCEPPMFAKLDILVLVK